MKKQLLTLLMVLSVLLGHAQTIIFQDDFENGPPFDTTAFPGWRPKTNLAGTINGLVENHLGGACNGSYSVRIGKTTDAGSLSRNALDLYLDLSAYSQVELTFTVSSFFDETQNFDGIYFNSDSSNQNGFVKVFDFKTSVWCQNNCGTFPPLDVDSMAASHGVLLSNKFVIRFQQSGTGDFNTSGDDDGIILDDVKVISPQLVTYSTIPFADNFDNNAPGMGNMWRWVFADKTCSSAVDVTRLHNKAEVANGIGFNSNYGLRLGKTCADGVTTGSAMDLHLNLSGNAQADLSFDIYSQGEAYNQQDGIYFSDNGGINFSKVFDFKTDGPLATDNWCQFNWGKFPPLHLDLLCNQYGLNSQSSTFIIRFQEYGTGDFNTSGDEDGFYIDNVNVYPVNRIYVPLPFQDDFDTNAPAFKLGWTWEFADSTALPAASATRINNIVDVYNSGQAGHGFVARLGKNCLESTPYTANALDLRLDLSNVITASLYFEIYDFADEDNNQDAIYFSNDGGVTFQQAYLLHMDSLPNFAWDTIQLDIVQLANTLGMNLTNQFIIRFQQYDNDDFGTTGDEDGYYIDNVNLSGTVGISELTKLIEFSIAPNPAKDNLTLNIHNNGINSKMRISNVIGETMYEQDFLSQKSINIDISKLSKGIYFIQVETNNGLSIKKFIKQ